MATVIVRAQITGDAASLGAATLPIYDTLTITALRQPEGGSRGRLSKANAAEPVPGYV